MIDNFVWSQSGSSRQAGLLVYLLARLVVASADSLVAVAAIRMLVERTSAAGFA
jgi:hypothetical protein